VAHDKGERREDQKGEPREKKVGVRFLLMHRGVEKAQAED